MTNFLRRLLRGPSSPPSQHDLESESARLLATLPPCAPLVVIASHRYSGNFRCEVTMPATVLGPLVAKLSQSTFGGTTEMRIARLAFPQWLRTAPQEGSTTSYLPPLFVRQIAPYVDDFVVDRVATVICPDCGGAIREVHMGSRNREVRGPWTEWTDGWRCALGHLLYTKDQEAHFLRNPASKS